MAEIEETEHGDEGRVREWMARAMRASGDPVWTADGTVSERWLPVSPSGRLDGWEWKVPLAEIGVTRPVIEVTTPPADTPAMPEPPPAAPENKPADKPRTRVKSSMFSKTTLAQPVIPLVHAPDDPGLDLGLDRDPVPETSGAPANDAWQRLRQLFR